MHIAPFTFKRAHFSTLKILRPFASRGNLTPARFDVLFVMHVFRAPPVQKPIAPVQCAIARRLGVSRPTVCKLVRALRELGILEQHPYRQNRCYKLLKLTRHGRRCFARVMRAMRRGTVNAAMRSAYNPPEVSRRRADELLRDTVGDVERFSAGIGERTTLYPLPGRASAEHRKWLGTLARARKRKRPQLRQQQGLHR